MTQTLKIMKIYFVLFSLFYSAALLAQQFSTTIQSNVGLDPDIRNILPLSDGNVAVAFDYQLDTLSMPVAGVMMLDASGDLIWSKTLIIPNSNASCSFKLEETSAGDVLLFGLNSNSDSTTMNGFLANISSVGTINAYREYHSGSGIGGYSVNNMTLLPNDEVLLLINVFASSIILKTDLNGDIIWGKSATIDTLGNGKSPGYDAIQLSSGDILCTGKYNSNFTLIKYDNNGNTLWMRKTNIGDYVQVKSIIENSDGRVFAAGTTGDLNALSAMIMEIDPDNGDIQWLKKLNQTHPTNTFGMETLLDDNDGLLFSSSYFYPNLFGVENGTDPSHLMKLDYDGNVIQTTQLIDGLILRDYPTINKFGTSDYVYGAKIIDGVDTISVVHRVNDLMKVNCVRELDTNFTSVIYTDIVDSVANSFESSFTDQISPIVSMSDISMSQNILCEDIGFVENNEPDLISYFNQNEKTIHYQNVGEHYYESYVIVDLLGKKIKAGKINPIDGVIRLNHLPIGLYIFSATGIGSNSSLKFEVR